jgi:hypothetical protein
MWEMSTIHYTFKKGIAKWLATLWGGQRFAMRYLDFLLFI